MEAGPLRQLAAATLLRGLWDLELRPDDDDARQFLLSSWAAQLAEFVELDPEALVSLVETVGTDGRASYTITELSSATGIPDYYIRKAVRRGELELVHHSRPWRIPKAAGDKWASGQK
jgi:excisionase family DNA binding protein